MPQILEPRVVRLSWRPPTTAYGATHVSAWVSRLKQRLRRVPLDLKGREIKLHDMNAPATNRAEARDGPWTDFLAIYTIDYCEKCSEEGEASELYEAWLRRDMPGQLLWLVRLEEDDPAGTKVGDWFPWRKGLGWNFLPAPYPEPPLKSDPGQEADSEMEKKCLGLVRASDPSTSGQFNLPQRSPM